MKIADITVQGVEAISSVHSKITAGMVGATVQIQYPDPYWSGLVKNVVFRGAEEQSVLNTGETVEIPARVIAKANARLMIGIVGVSAAGNTQVTPTIWAELGVVNAAPYVSQQISGGGKPPVLGTPPSQNAPLWAQVEAMIGDLNSLGTADRANVVAAINELVRQTGNVEGLITDDKTSIVSAINWIVREGIGTPEIGSNGNWIIGGKDTGLPSRGPKGDHGASGVYVGSGEMPDGYNVQIDPDGEPLDFVIDPEAIKAAVDEYLEENPPAQGEPGKTPVKGEDYFTPEDVQEIAELAAGLVEVPEGGGGGIDVTGAKVGQTVKVAEVDENGSPTRWLPANFPVQLPFCGCKTRLIVDQTVATDDGGNLPSRLEISERSDGNPLNLQAFVIQTDIMSAASYHGLDFNDRSWMYMSRYTPGARYTNTFFIDKSGGVVSLSHIADSGYYPVGSASANGYSIPALNGAVNKITIPSAGSTLSKGTFIKIWEIYTE